MFARIPRQHPLAARLSAVAALALALSVTLAASARADLASLLPEPVRKALPTAPLPPTPVTTNDGGSQPAPPLPPAPVGSPAPLPNAPAPLPVAPTPSTPHLQPPHVRAPLPPPPIAAKPPPTPVLRHPAAPSGAPAPAPLISAAHHARPRPVRHGTPPLSRAAGRTASDASHATTATGTPGAAHAASTPVQAAKPVSAHPPAPLAPLSLPPSHGLSRRSAPTSTFGLPLSRAAGDALLIAALLAALVVLIAFFDSVGVGPRHRAWRRTALVRLAPVSVRLLAARQAFVALRRRLPARPWSRAYARALEELVHR